jgi:MraZ protein
MARFRGRYDFSIDEKGRINIPFKFRKLLSPEAEDTFVISRGPDGCLWAYPKDEWEKFEESLDDVPETRESNKLQRVLQNTLNDSTLDKQGRISLTPLQMRIVGITKEASIIGRGKHLEIWDTRKFEEHVGDEKYDDMYYQLIETIQK